MGDVRLRSIEISGIKNVLNGKIEFPLAKKNETGYVDVKSEIVGIYGQNGSGKTAVITALWFLKLLMSGDPLPDDTCDYINNDCNSATIKASFFLSWGEFAWYEAVIKKTVDASPENDDGGFIISAEKVSYSEIKNGKPGRKTTLIEYDENTPSSQEFMPNKMWEIYINRDSIHPGADRETAKKENKSFVFYNEDSSDEYGLSDNWGMERLWAETNYRDLPLEFDTKEDYEEWLYWKDILEDKEYEESVDKMWLLRYLIWFANNDFFVVGVTGSDRSDFSIIFRSNNRPSYKKSSGTEEYTVNIAKPKEHKREKISYKQGTDEWTYEHITKPIGIPSKDRSTVESIIKHNNEVINAIVPGLSLELRSIGVLEGDKEESFEIISLRDGKAIPLRQESEGIRKIISMLYALILAYNDPFTIVAIDELDAGVYEYLLGEILQVFDETGKGQLIFTSHNLRALEVLDKTSIVFTTTNPENKFISPKYIKANNNLRDVYLRSIRLGGQDEELYSETKMHAIRRAMRKAGEAAE